LKERERDLELKRGIACWLFVVSEGKIEKRERVMETVLLDLKKRNLRERDQKECGTKSEGRRKRKRE